MKENEYIWDIVNQLWKRPIVMVVIENKILDICNEHIYVFRFVHISSLIIQ